MDDVAALECGALTPPPAPPPAPVALSATVARNWAWALGLRPGNTRGPTPTALVPVVDSWARECGQTGPGFRALGLGLVWAGLRRRMERQRGHLGQHFLALHRDDAALLWRMVRAAWAPRFAPGDERGRKRRRRVGPSPRRLRPTLQLFHEVLATLGKRARPLVDSMGRVWPGPTVAARALRGNPKALGNAVAWLQAALVGGPSTDSRSLRSALSRGASWRGVWWRYLTPEELEAVPPGHLVGLPLPGMGWGLTCPHCGGRPSAK